MRPLHQLIDRKDPAWPQVQQWIAEAAAPVEALPTRAAAGNAALHATQVTTRSPMGAIARHSAGLLIDHGWLRILGAGGHPRLQRSLPGWNAGRSSGYWLIADDAVGGFFAIDGGAFSGDAGGNPGDIWYLAPDTLRWEPCEMGYSQFLVWAMSGALADFYAPLRWDGWVDEVQPLTGDQVIHIYPFPWAKGPPLKNRNRRPVPIAEQWALQQDLQGQLKKG
jgi:hypothetical protein